MLTKTITTGKSTTVGIIERFYDVDEGVVEYNGVDLTKLNLQWYREKIGYVGQEPTLCEFIPRLFVPGTDTFFSVNETIAMNISWGVPEHRATKLFLQQDKRMLMISSWVFPKAMRLRWAKEEPRYPEAKNSGMLISAFSIGTNLLPELPLPVHWSRYDQHLCLADLDTNSNLKHPEILILDEATSALDNESEAIVQAAIDKLMESRQQTCIVIAHRLSTIREADKIVVVADGIVAEHGTHDELIAKPHGRYKRLFESSKRDARANVPALSTSVVSGVVAVAKDEDDEINWEEKIEEEAVQKLDTNRALKMAVPDVPYILLGAVGAVMVGSICK